MNLFFKPLRIAITATDWLGLLIDAGVKSSILLLFVFIVLSRVGVLQPPSGIGFGCSR